LKKYTILTSIIRFLIEPYQNWIMSFKNIKLSFFTFVVTLTLFFLSSCTTYKKLPYLTDVDIKAQLPTVPHEPRIMPNDILSITVNSTVPGAVLDFNLPVVPQGSNDATAFTIAQTTNYSGTLQNYIVDKNGNIDFPVLGTLALGGKTLQEVQDSISSLIFPRYVSERPIVTVRFLDFKVYVLGEVQRPGVYTSINGQMTVLDALAAAGDLTIYGKRRNVMLIRTDKDGNTVFHRINLQSTDFVQREDLYYLQQNDKIYVETNAAKGNSSAISSITTVALSAVSVLISVIAMLK